MKKSPLQLFCLHKQINSGMIKPEYYEAEIPRLVYRVGISQVK
jgi:hypothetical protein